MPRTFRNHVFVSAGEMRLVVIVIGKGGEAVPLCCVATVCGTEQVSVALSQVSHGSSLPSLPGRCVTILLNIARTSRGIQPMRKGTWSACIPRSPMQPYSPLKATLRFQLIGLFGSRSEE